MHFTKPETLLNRLFYESPMRFWNGQSRATQLLGEVKQWIATFWTLRAIRKEKSCIRSKSCPKITKVRPMCLGSVDYQPSTLKSDSFSSGSSVNSSKVKSTCSSVCSVTFSIKLAGSSFLERIPSSRSFTTLPIRLPEPVVNCPIPFWWLHLLFAGLYLCLHVLNPANLS